MDQVQATKNFYKLVWPHRTDVLRFAQFLCRDRSVAEDLSQETLLKAFKAMHRVVVGQNLKAWLLTILRNTWTDRVRVTAKDREVNFTAVIDEPAAEVIEAFANIDFWENPQALLEAFSDQQMIDALQNLPNEIRWTLLLVDVQGLSMQEAAAVLEVPAGTIKSRAHRGKIMLRQMLERQAPKKKV